MCSRSFAVRWRAVRARGAGTSLAALTCLALGAAAAAAQAPAGAGVTIERFLGSWELVEWVATSQQGQTTHPFGEDALGQVTYTADGRMSAHLMRPPEDPDDAPPQHLAYWGTFSLQAAEGTVTHHVIGVDRSNWIGTDQVRRFRFDEQGRLILSLGQQHLTWQRAR